MGLITDPAEQRLQTGQAGADALNGTNPSDTMGLSDAGGSKDAGYAYSDEGRIIVTDDWTAKEHARVPAQYKPFAVVDIKTGWSATQITRTYYDETGMIVKQVHSGNHGMPKYHSRGIHGEHVHEYRWENGERIDETVRELSDSERKENGDILE